MKVQHEYYNVFVLHVKIVKFYLSTTNPWQTTSIYKHYNNKDNRRELIHIHSIGTKPQIIKEIRIFPTKQSKKTIIGYDKNLNVHDNTLYY